MQLPLLLLLAAAVASTQATVQVSLGELLCSTNLTAYNVNVPDELDVPPVILVDKQETPILFEIVNATLQDLVFVTINTDAASFTAYDWTGEQTGSALTFDEVGKAVTIQPGEFLDCIEQPGCDGFMIDAIAFKKKFPTNTSYVLFRCTLQYASNGSVTLLSDGKRWMTMSLLSADTVLGNSPQVTANISFADTITPAGAAATSSSDWSAGTIAGVTIGAILGCLVIMLIGCGAWTRHVSNGQESIPLSKQNGGDPGYYAGRFGYGKKTHTKEEVNNRVHALQHGGKKL